MKKLLILSASLMVSACACFNSSEPAEEQVVYTQSAAAAPQNCDYFDGKTCYRYVRRQRTVAAPEPIRYRNSSYTASCAQCTEPAVPSDGSCAPKIRETREPVEIVYKKTTYKTVYEPKTYTSVSYERSPYSSSRQEYVYEKPAPRVVAQPEYFEADNEEEILLNVK